MLLLMGFIIFYPIAIFFSFRAYKEFKGMLYDNGMGGQMGGLSGMMAGRRSTNAADDGSA
jgi:hypothetical protein